MSEIEQYKSHIRGLEAQLNACKAMLNDAHTTSLQLRSSLIIFQQDAQEIHRAKEDLQKEVDNHKNVIESLTAKILELSPPKVEEKLHAVEDEAQSA
jgi:chromosome segregation ATPase